MIHSRDRLPKVDLVMLGIPWLAASAHGLFSGFSWERLILLAIPILAVHVLVIPTYMGSWSYQWASLIDHSIVAIPLGVALYLSLQRIWDMLRRQMAARAALVGASVVGVVSLVALAPGMSGATVAASLVAVSVFGAMAAHVELG